MTPVLDPSHFARAVTGFGDKRPLVVERAIYNAHGVKIIDKGVRVDSRLYERLTQHHLEVPLADCLQARPVPTAPVLRQRAEALISQQPFLAALLAGDRQRDHLLDELTHLPLPRPVSLQLAVLEESQPVAWAYALRSMLIAG
ncbi:MAG: hypothetical protein OEU93_05585 [Rubrivivax sp.]|nr:hypothetical protein [Rubrivivax sp.]